MMEDKCPSRADGVHDCTGPNSTCPCGHKFKVERFCFSLSVYDNKTKSEVLEDSFMASHTCVIEDALREAISKLEAID